MTQKGIIHQGEIYWVIFDPSMGHEFKGKRPALVVQSEKKLKKSNLVTVIPLTSNLKNQIEDDVLIKKDKSNRLFADSVLKISCLMSFDYSRFTQKIGRVENKVIEAVKDSLKAHFAM